MIDTLEQIGNKIRAMKSFNITNWCVITGAPSSGKTAVLNFLNKKGYTISPDISRIYIEQEINKGVKKEIVRGDENKLQNEIFIWMVKTEINMPKEELIFMEYALPDNLPFLKMASIKPSKKFLKSFELFKYKNIFILDPLPITTDEVRTENSAIQNKLHKLIISTYKDLGYKPIRIPKLSVAERVNMILSHIS